MAQQFISRSDRNKELVSNVNNDIAQLKELRKTNVVLSSAIAQLNQVDKEHFDFLVKEIEEAFDVMKFYIDKDKSKNAINPDIPYVIENYISTIVGLFPESEFESDNARARSEGKLIENEVYAKIELQELSNEMARISSETNKQLIEHNGSINADSKLAAYLFEPQVVASWIKANKDLPTKDLVLRAKQEMYSAMNDIINKREKYKVKTKWFFIVAPIILAAMIMCIIIPLLV